MSEASVYVMDVSIIDDDCRFSLLANWSSITVNEYCWHNDDIEDYSLVKHSGGSDGNYVILPGMVDPSIITKIKT